MNIWRFTGNPENWLTAISHRAWALNEKKRSIWENKIKPGDIVVFHATQRSDFSRKNVSAIIGFGHIADNFPAKNDFWWFQEVRDQKNYWPYVVPFKAIYIYSNIDNIDLKTPVDQKSLEQVQKDIEVLLKAAIPISFLNKAANKKNQNIPKFPVNGSASRINSFYEQVLMMEDRDIFVAEGSQQSEELLDKRSAIANDEIYLNVPLETAKREILLYKDDGQPGHTIKFGIKKIRRENQKQKRLVARVENYTCQICGFSCEYATESGRKAWIYNIDHIIEKSDEGNEEAKNLWVLCPNCHEKKTRGIIKIDVEKKLVTENGKEIKLKSDNHLFKE